jgi:ABC-2 type transport system permease protein
VADVGRTVGIAEQIRLVAWLRWRILHNSLRRKQNRLDLVGLVVVSALAAVFVGGVCFAFFAGTYGFLSSGKVTWIGLLFWAIFLWWQLFPVFVAGFGASFEFRTLLRFPLSRVAFYVIGLAYGLADFAAIAALCWLLSMIIGAAAAEAEIVPVMLVVVLLFVLLNVTLERLIGSWLERLLARRRTRELFFALFILLMISMQLTGPLLNRYGNTAVPWVIRIWPYLSPLPPSLAGSAIMSASTGDLGVVLLGMAGLCLYVLIFGGLLWLRFSSQYRGEELSETPAPEGRLARPLWNVKAPKEVVPIVRPQVAAVIQKEFRYLMRNGFAALLLLLPPMLVFILISQATLTHFSDSQHPVSPETFFPGLMAYIILLLMAPAYNSFAYENTGIQTYFTAPLRFRDVFLGKNLVQVCLILTELVLCITAFAYRVGLPSMPTFLATCAAIVFTIVGQLSIANWSSLSFPRKLAFGQLHGQRQSGMAVLVAFGSQILLFGISSIILMLGRWTGDRWLPAEAFALLAVAAAGGYVAALDALTRFAEKKKETLIEALCK